MAIFGIGIHIIIALFFAIHAIRSGQQLYWLFILFAFPMLGSIVYFAAVFLPNSRLEQGARKAVAAAAKTLDPTRELREARAAFDYTPTAQNQMRLALALLETGAAEEAAVNYEACLKGPFASDPEIRFCAARAFVESGRYATAIAHLEELRKANPTFRTEQVGLLVARSLAGAGRNDEARREFEATLQRHASFDVQAEYAIWAYMAGDKETAAKLQAELDKTLQRWNRQTKDLNSAVIRRLNAAIDFAKQRG